VRRLYTLALYLLTPLVLLRLAARGVRTRAYWRRWPERFGRFSYPRDKPSIWLHAVSVGEVQAAAPLVEALRVRLPEVPLVVTTTTPTGSERVHALFGADVFHVYAPYDLPGAVGRFLRHISPCIAVILERELWPNLFAACYRASVPIVLVNARVSPRAVRHYRFAGSLIREALGRVSAVAAQSEADADRLVGLGAHPDHVRVTGSLKFDVRMPPGLEGKADRLRAQWGLARRVWIAASTHAGEEEVILAAFGQLRQRSPDLLLIMVPRHPERFAAVAGLCRGEDWTVDRLSKPTGRPDIDIMVGDTMGDLPLLYAASDVAFTGGSLIPAGGHNPLEAAMLGRPTVFGPYMDNVALIAQLLLEAQASRQIKDVSDIVNAVGQWLEDPEARQSAGRRAVALIEQHRGATGKVVAMIEAILQGGKSQEPGARIQNPESRIQNTEYGRQK
jgi:3-deoxy-D-manno-octulosonic-acid transferase